MHRWRSPEIRFDFRLANSCVDTAYGVYLGDGLLKNNVSFSVACSWFKAIDFRCSLLKTGKRPIF